MLTSFILALTMLTNTAQAPQEPAQGEQGAECELDSECAEGLTCEYPMLGGGPEPEAESGTCEVFCESDADCDSDESCNGVICA